MRKNRQERLKRKDHHYLNHLCASEGLTYEQLYKRRDLLTNSLKSELFYLIKEERNKEKNNEESNS